MNINIRKLFSCCIENKVVVIETNFSEFYRSLKKYEPNCKCDRWYFNKFKESPEFKQDVNGVEFYFQRLV